MKVTDIKPDQILEIGCKVIHKNTLEIGEYIGECLGFGKCKVVYPDNKMWYPQPKRNIMLIENVKS